MRRWVWMMLLALLLAACGKKDAALPRSGGRPYEVLLIGQDTAAVRVVKVWFDGLTDDSGTETDETAFDVSAVTGRLTQATRYARNIVEVSIEPSATRTRIYYSNNVYSTPQLLVRVCAASPAALRSDLMRLQTDLKALLTEAEMSRERVALEQYGDPQGTQAVAEMFGCRLLVPAGMTAIKRGKNFLWLSDNGARMTRSICVYSYPATALDKAAAIDRRDSVMRQNVPGEQPGMFVQTERRMPVTAVAMRRGTDRLMKCAGRWQMEGDAMGGPFEGLSLLDSVQGRVVVADAFIYAPGQKKRNAMRQLAAAVSTLALEKK